MNDRKGFLVKSLREVILLVLVIVKDAGKKAVLSCARSHFCAIRLAASNALSTRAREGEDWGVWSSRSR